jgi:SAM-dependent methyltransferase
MSPDESTERLRAYYATCDEWGRLETPAGELELLRTLDLLDRHLLPASHVLDLGGGPGRYAVELARRGHRVAVADISPELCEQARRRIAAAGVEGSVSAVETLDGVSLRAFGARSFDAVVALGPYYHLVHAADRLMLTREITRVARDGARVVIAFMPRASGVAGLLIRAAERPEQVPPGSLERALADGVFVNGTGSGFQEGFYAEPAELRSLFEAHGCSTRALLSVKGLGAGREQAVLGLRARSPELFREALAVIDASAARPEVVACGDHALWIGELDARGAPAPVP